MSYWWDVWYVTPNVIQLDGMTRTFNERIKL
jgi:hypothetical protein